MFFKKKIKDVPVVCNHKWKDFPCYSHSIYYTDVRRIEYKLIEPYVCIHCKERKDVRLSERTRRSLTKKEADDWITDYEAELKSKGLDIQDEAIVEDMINDFQLIDREYLEIAAKLYPSRF